ncbi:Spo0B domain-containing protein [Brevibacillus sp. AG]|uniref:sensor histidine kinase n=1 Tax=Brevibacillus sp. AG TaxID=3020891 RepID=UPI00232DC753|nr:Spo0B domain-containing protein [Brevibacillus sp. AG]MDC0763474.1 Spo0B domain-containing protein [Brevibacillus sp. AG]
MDNTEIILLLLVCYSFYVTVALVQKSVRQPEPEPETQYNQQLNYLTSAVRSIRHNAMSHYTVILGYLKLKDYQRVEDYVKSLAAEAKRLTDITEHVKNKTISALLYEKMSQSLKEGIDFQLKVSPNGPQLEAWDVQDVRLLISNLLDTAFESAQSFDGDGRYIKFEWGCRDHTEYLFVEHSGSMTENTEQTDIKRLVAKYNGEINAVSGEGITRVTLMLQSSKKGSQKGTDNHTDSA